MVCSKCKGRTWNVDLKALSWINQSLCACVCAAWPGRGRGGVKSCCTGGDGHLHCVHLHVVKQGFASRSAAVCSCTCTCVRESKFYYLALQSGFTEAPSVTAVRYPTHIHTRAHTGQGDHARTMPATATGSQGQRWPGMCLCVCARACVCVCLVMPIPKTKA